MKTLLAFDFGNKKIGVAVGNDIIRQAQAVKMILCFNGDPDWQAVKDIINQWKPDKMVVGLPLNLDGTENEQCKRSRAFASDLSKRFNVPVDMQDERYSSSHVNHQLHDTFANDAKIKRKLIAKRDQIAAQLILQSYFNHEN